MSQKNSLYGFTLIELLVVISIISLTASIVLASVGQARNKAANSAIMQNMNNAQNQGELFYYANGNSYGTLPTESDPLGSPDTQNVCKEVANVNGTVGIYKFLRAARDAGGFGQDIGTSPLQWGGYDKVSCNINAGNSWAAIAPLKESTLASPRMYCVDSTGARIIRNSASLPYWQYSCIYTP